jgi:hypothetical protein
MQGGSALVRFPHIALSVRVGEAWVGASLGLSCHSCQRCQDWGKGSDLGMVFWALDKPIFLKASWC